MKTKDCIITLSSGTRFAILRNRMAGKPNAYTVYKMPESDMGSVETVGLELPFSYAKAFVRGNTFQCLTCGNVKPKRQRSNKGDCRSCHMRDIG